MIFNKRLLLILCVLAYLPACSRKKCCSRSTTQKNIAIEIDAADTVCRTIDCKMNITKDMLGVKKFGTHYPTTFDVTVNNQTVKNVETKQVTLNNDKLIISYDWSFMNGYRKGTNHVEYKVKPDAKDVTITFSWKKDRRLTVDNAEFVKETKA